jgi:hypothetical protein
VFVCSFRRQEKRSCELFFFELQWAGDTQCGEAEREHDEQHLILYCCSLFLGTVTSTRLRWDTNVCARVLFLFLVERVVFTIQSLCHDDGLLDEHGVVLSAKYKGREEQREEQLSVGQKLTARSPWKQKEAGRERVCLRTRTCVNPHRVRNEYVKPEKKESSFTAGRKRC